MLVCGRISHEGSRILQWFASSSTPNPVARAVRPVTLGRTNHLFAGSDGGEARWATVCSLIETTRLNGVEPYAYLSDVLRRMVDGHPASRLDELLPWGWEPAGVDT